MSRSVADFLTFSGREKLHGLARLAAPSVLSTTRTSAASLRPTFRPTSRGLNSPSLLDGRARCARFSGVDLSTELLHSERSPSLTVSSANSVIDHLQPNECLWTQHNRQLNREFIRRVQKHHVADSDGTVSADTKCEGVVVWHKRRPSWRTSRDDLMPG